MHARAFAGLNAVVEDGSDSLSKESAVFDLLSLHMQLVRAHQSQQAPGEAPFMSPHLWQNSCLQLSVQVYYLVVSSSCRHIFN